MWERSHLTTACMACQPLCGRKFPQSVCNLQKCVVKFDQIGGEHMFTGEKVSTFRERFTQLVDESNKSLSQLSRELHISNQTLSAWRTGVRSPKEPTIIAVADYFKVNVKWLMGFDVVKKVNRHMIISNSELFRKIIMNMDASDYETVMNIFEKTEMRMRENGKL